MNSKGKFIGLNQRIPFDVLDAAIHSFLVNGIVDKTRVFEHMQEFTAGVNRASKASKYVVQILSRQENLLIQLKKQLKDLDYSSLKVDDRKALTLCLISLTYPITYDLLIALAQGFKVQSQINKKFINEKVMAIYGSNRTVDIAIDALLPILIEHKTIQRDKVSLYSIGSRLSVSNRFILELIIYADIKLSGTKSILTEDINYKPWYSYFDFTIGDQESYKHLIVRKDSSVGKGYLTIGG